MANTVDVVITATDQASKVLLGVSQVINSISESVIGLTSGFIAYGDQVRSLSDFVGTSNEETSRMIQLADDAFVGFETLRMASKKMSEDGIQPTTENIARLADQFVKLKPGVEQSQFLMDKFGRAGIEMTQIMKMGGDQVRKMSAAIDDSMVIDDEKAMKITYVKRALDEFNDSMEGMKFQVAEKLLDIFGQMPKPLQDATLAFGTLFNPTNVNMLIQFGILMKGVDIVSLARGFQVASLYAAEFAVRLLPIVAPLAAIALLVYTLNKLWAMDEWKQGLAALRGQATLAFTGDKVRAAESALAGYRELGGGAPGSGATGEEIRGFLGYSAMQQQAPMVVNYYDQSMIGTASPEKLQQAARMLNQLNPQAASSTTGRR